MIEQSTKKFAKNDEGQGNGQLVTQRVMVKNSPRACFEIATNFEAYPQWSKAITNVEVTRRDTAGCASVVEFSAEAVGRSTRYSLAYDFSEAPHVVRWQLLEGDIERHLEGSYEFEAVGEETEITYQLSVELKVPMPTFVKRRVEAQILGVALQELKQRAES